MSKFIPIQYHKRRYPDGISPKIHEVAGHFDVENLDSDSPFSLHTEYSFAARKLTSQLLEDFPIISSGHKNSIPQLWLNDAWAYEFAGFIDTLIDNEDNFKIVEVHPPFNDYCDSFSEFTGRYKVFENEVLTLYPGVDILIENRFGSQYRGGKFILASAEDFKDLAETIESNGLKLRIILDVPQLFTRYFGPRQKTADKIKEIFHQLKDWSGYIKGIHIWGKRRNDDGRWISHSGNLDTYFDNDKKIKSVFLEELFNLLDDGKTRYSVPEVNSSDEDLESIVNDLRQVGFKFI